MTSIYRIVGGAILILLLLLCLILPGFGRFLKMIGDYDE